jgi:hypothetical protein
VTLYLASGTDHIYVQEEAGALGVDTYFGEHIYGARDDSTFQSKEQIIQRIMDEHNLKGEELLVVGDGPVEIRNAKSRAALALGVAADEVRRQGLAPRKRERLLAAGADLIVTDFLIRRTAALDCGLMPPARPNRQGDHERSFMNCSSSARSGTAPGVKLGREFWTSKPRRTWRKTAGPRQPGELLAGGSPPWRAGRSRRSPRPPADEARSLRAVRAHPASCMPGMTTRAIPHVDPGQQPSQSSSPSTTTPGRCAR